MMKAANLTAMELYDLSIKQLQVLELELMKQEQTPPLIFCSSDIYYSQNENYANKQNQIQKGNYYNKAVAELQKLPLQDIYISLSNCYLLKGFDLIKTNKLDYAKIYMDKSLQKCIPII